MAYLLRLPNVFGAFGLARRLPFSLCGRTSKSALARPVFAGPAVFAR